MPLPTELPSGYSIRSGRDEFNQPCVNAYAPSGAHLGSFDYRSTAIDAACDHAAALAEEASWDADDLGLAISEAFHDSNDIDGPHWPTVARKVAETIDFPLTDKPAIRPLDLIWERVNALGGYTDPKDSAAVAWGKELDAVIALIESFGGRDPAPIRAAIVAHVTALDPAAQRAA